MGAPPPAAASSSESVPPAPATVATEGVDGALPAGAVAREKRGWTRELAWAVAVLAVSWATVRAFGEG